MKESLEITTPDEEALRNVGDVEAAVEMSFMEAEEHAMAEAEEWKLKWAHEVIEKFHQERSNKNDQ